MSEITQTLNARRLLCPMPLIRTQNAIKKLQFGEILEVICTDPGTEYDIPTWCRMYEHKLLLQEQRETVDEMVEYCFVIEKGNKEAE
ncbi:MAG: SirA family protein [Gammaproteobacteria bacterium]|nr:SirA family protein [Gammaproteobacteria bacterium]